MVILVDMDDTIEHLLVPWLDWLNRQYGKNVRESDVVSWSMQVAYPDLTIEQIFAPLDMAEFWDTVTPVEGAPEALKRMIERGHEVYVVTSTPPYSVEAKMERVLFRYFPFIPWSNVIITGNKQMLKADVMIDDGVHNLEGGNYVKILVDAPYNRAYDETQEGMIRVRNWSEIEEVMREIERGRKEP